MQSQQCVSLCHVCISASQCTFLHVFSCFEIFRDISRYLEIFWAIWVAQVRISLQLPFAASRFFKIYWDILRYFEIFWDFGSFFCIKHFFQIKHVESQNHMFSLPTKPTDLRSLRSMVQKDFDDCCLSWETVGSTWTEWQWSVPDRAEKWQTKRPTLITLPKSSLNRCKDDFPYVPLTRTHSMRSLNSVNNSLNFANAWEKSRLKGQRHPALANRALHHTCLPSNVLSKVQQLHLLHPLLIQQAYSPFQVKAIPGWLRTYQYLLQLVESTWAIAGSEEHRASQPGENRNVVVPTTCWGSWHHPKGGYHDGDPTLALAEELRSQYGESTDCGDHYDVLTSSHATSEAPAQTSSTTPSSDIDSMILVLFVLTPYTMANTLSIFYAFRVHKPDWCFYQLSMGWNLTQNWRQFWKAVPISTIFGLNFGVTRPLFEKNRRSQLCVIHTHQQYATQILHRIGFDSCAGQRIQSLTEVSSAYSW